MAMQTSSNLWGQSCLLGKRAPPGVLSSGLQYSVHCVRNCNAKTSQSSVLLSPPSLVENQGDLSSKQTWRASIDFKWIRENKDAVAANIRNRKSAGDVELVVELYEQSVNLSQEIDKLRSERNAVASAMKGKLDLAFRVELIEQGKQLKEQVAELEGNLAVLLERLQQEGQRIPNMTHPSVPIGSEDVASLRKEVSGTKFYYLKNEAVLLELALINWTLSQLLLKGFVPLSTPDLVRSTVLEKCGFQPRGQNTQVYSVEGTDLCLAGTAEVPVGGMYMDSILPEASLPLKLVAFSHCFRTEAGAAGAATSSANWRYL
ncbi:hypothetical protein CY35_18G064900 [Sphagnum magellanicum]|nr:hypothetical protein CY35_18G064900 [Sphagnum magellanicum]